MIYILELSTARREQNGDDNSPFKRSGHQGALGLLAMPVIPVANLLSFPQSTRLEMTLKVPESMAMAQRHGFIKPAQAALFYFPQDLDSSLD